jgi:microcystin-dependent protein
MSSILRRTSNFTAHEKPVTGDMKMSFVPHDHIGWIKCDGRSLSTAEYNLLFQVIGYQFGGSGSTFQLPNPSGGVVGVVGQRSTSVTTTLHPAGQEVGEEKHQLTIPEMPSHAHTITDPGHAHSYVNNVNDQNTDNAFGTETAADQVDLNQTTGTSTTGITVNSTGGNQAHNIMQPTLFMGNMFIYSGIPSYPGFNPSSWPKTSTANPPLI